MKTTIRVASFIVLFLVAVTVVDAMNHSEFMDQLYQMQLNSNVQLEPSLTVTQAGIRGVVFPKDTCKNVWMFVFSPDSRYPIVFPFEIFGDGYLGESYYILPDIEIWQCYTVVAVAVASWRLRDMPSSLSPRGKFYNIGMKGEYGISFSSFKPKRETPALDAYRKQFEYLSAWQWKNMAACLYRGVGLVYARFYIEERSGAVQGGYGYREIGLSIYEGIAPSISEAIKTGVEGIDDFSTQYKYLMLESIIR